MSATTKAEHETLNHEQRHIKANIKRRKKLHANTNFWYIESIFDYLNVSTIYAFYATLALKAIFFTTAIFILYPLSFVFRMMDCYSSWVNYFHEHNEKGKKKGHNLVLAVITTLTVLLIGTAVAATIVGAPLLATIAFGANLVMMMVYRIVSGVFELGKSFATPHPTSQHERNRKRIYKERGISQLAIALTMAMTATTGIAISIFGVMAIWPLGVLGGLVGAGLCVYGLYSEYISHKNDMRRMDDEFNLAASNSADEDSTTQIRDGLGIKHEATPDINAKREKTLTRIGDAIEIEELDLEKGLESSEDNTPRSHASNDDVSDPSPSISLRAS